MLIDAVFSVSRLTNATLLMFSGLIMYWIVWVIYARTFHPLSGIPGPFFASISRGWIIVNTLLGDMDRTQHSLHQRYGPLVRIAPNEIACADAHAIKKIYPTQRPLKKSDFYLVWGNRSFSKYPDNFSGTDEKVHSERRKIVNNIYSLSNILQSEQFIDRCSQLFIAKLDQFAETSQVIDLGEWLQWYAFDVIGELYFGQMFGFLETESDHDTYIRSLDTLLPVMVTLAVAPSYSRTIILVAAWLSSPARIALKAIDHIANAARSCVAGRQTKSSLTADGEVRRDLLQQLLDIIKEKGNKVDFGIHEVEYEAYVALFAGSDTTAIALCAVIYYLLKNPTVYHQLRAEIDTAASSGQLSSPVQYAEAIKLPFLCACIKEAMRLHPSVGLTMPRVVPAGGIEVAGRNIRQGYRVGMNAAVIHRDKSIFGDDANDFRPARWLEGDAAVLDRYLLTFGAGTRTCIGKNISLSEIHKLIPFILQKFDLELANSDGTWRTQNLWFHKQSGLEVRLKLRKQYTTGA